MQYGSNRWRQFVIGAHSANVKNYELTPRLQIGASL